MRFSGYLTSIYKKVSYRKQIVRQEESYVVYFVNYNNVINNQSGNKTTMLKCCYDSDTTKTMSDDISSAAKFDIGETMLK